MIHDPTQPAHDRKEAEARRALEYGSSGSAADVAVDGRPRLEDRFIDTPYARPAEPVPDGAPVDQLAEKKRLVGDDREALLDESVEETFPASDPPCFQPRST
jgi:hypothetical protein